MELLVAMRNFKFLEPCLYFREILILTQSTRPLNVLSNQTLCQIKLTHGHIKLVFSEMATYAIDWDQHEF